MPPKKGVFSSSNNAPSLLKLLITPRDAHAIDLVDPMNLVLSKDVDVVLLELPRRHVALKHQVQLRESAAPRLGNPEIRIDDAAETNAAPEEACIVAPFFSNETKNVSFVVLWSIFRGLDHEKKEV
jgi:hypothetical protein